MGVKGTDAKKLPLWPILYLTCEVSPAKGTEGPVHQEVRWSEVHDVFAVDLRLFWDFLYFDPLGKPENKKQGLQKILNQ